MGMSANISTHVVTNEKAVRIIGLGLIYSIKSQKPIISVKDNNTTSGVKRGVSQLK